MKKRPRSSIESDVQAFANAADRPAPSSDPTAPRGKKRGGKDVLLPMNEYEHGMIQAAARQEQRSVSAFIRLAAVEKALATVDHEQDRQAPDDDDTQGDNR